jgi:hypothetical protein
LGRDRYCLIAHCGYVSTAAAQTSLSGENSRELERLLAVQSEKTAVPYSVTQPPRIPVDALDRYFMWNEIALDTTAIDHTPVDPASGEDPRRFGEQLGPHRSSYAMAIVHIAMFDAVNAIRTNTRATAALRRRTEIFLWIVPLRKRRMML